MKSFFSFISIQRLPVFVAMLAGWSAPVLGQEFKEDKSTGKWMFVTDKGKNDKSVMYDSVKPFSFGLAPVMQLEKWGCINDQNNWVLDPGYEEVDILQGEVIRIKSEGVYGIINDKGKILVQPEFDAIDHYLDGHGTVKSEGSWYALTPEGLREGDVIFQSPDQKAYIQGCDPGDYTCCTEKMAMSIFRSIRYPALAKENGIQGIVILSAIIDEQGRMTRHHVRRGIFPVCDEEAMRVFLEMDFQWIPARHEGRIVKQRIFFPVKFALQG